MVRLIGKPNWFHPKGARMCIEVFDPSQKYLSIKNNAARLVINPHQDLKEHWQIEWLIHRTRFEFARGMTILNNDDLALAFGPYQPGLRTPPEAEWIHNSFEGAPIGRTGRFIRSGEYVNIPCPGTGHDGDPNVSIYVDTQIRDAVIKLLLH